MIISYMIGMTAKRREEYTDFTHPMTALRNADRDFDLTDTERDIIKKHMFPLTVIPPTCREGWIVCLADKYCSLYETFEKRSVQKDKYKDYGGLC